MVLLHMCTPSPLQGRGRKGRDGTPTHVHTLTIVGKREEGEGWYSYTCAHPHHCREEGGRGGMVLLHMCTPSPLQGRGRKGRDGTPTHVHTLTIVGKREEGEGWYSYTCAHPHHCREEGGRGGMVLLHMCTPSPLQGRGRKGRDGTPTHVHTLTIVGKREEGEGWYSYTCVHTLTIVGKREEGEGWYSYTCAHPHHCLKHKHKCTHTHAETHLLIYREHTAHSLWWYHNILTNHDVLTALIEGIVQ